MSGGQEESTTKKLIFYILSIETTILLSLAAWFFGVYPDLVTKAEMAVNAPYVRDRELIMSKLGAHGDTMAKISILLSKMDEKFTKEIHNLDLQIARMEARNGK